MTSKEALNRLIASYYGEPPDLDMFFSHHNEWFSDMDVEDRSTWGTMPARNQLPIEKRLALAAKAKEWLGHYARLDAAAIFSAAQEGK